MITLDGLGKSFGQRSLFKRSSPFHAVRDVSLSVERGRTLGIVGEFGVREIHRVADGLAPHSPHSGKGFDRRPRYLGARLIGTQGPQENSPAGFPKSRIILQSAASIGAILSAPLEVHGIEHQVQPFEEGRRNCWNGSDCRPTMPLDTHISCPAGRSSALPSPGRLSLSPRSCWQTSRHPRHLTSPCRRKLLIFSRTQNGAWD